MYILDRDFYFVSPDINEVCWFDRGFKFNNLYITNLRTMTTDVINRKDMRKYMEDVSISKLNSLNICDCFNIGLSITTGEVDYSSWNDMSDLAIIFNDDCILTNNGNIQLFLSVVDSVFDYHHTLGVQVSNYRYIIDSYVKGNIVEFKLNNEEFFVFKCDNTIFTCLYKGMNIKGNSISIVYSISYTGLGGDYYVVFDLVNGKIKTSICKRKFVDDVYVTEKIDLQSQDYFQLSGKLIGDALSVDTGLDTYVYKLKLAGVIL